MTCTRGIVVRSAALPLLVALACAGAGASRGPGGAAGRAVEALVVRNDAAAAQGRVDPLVARRTSDPWARLTAALLARRGLDPAAEARNLLALVAAAPDDPLALVALRRLSLLAEQAPAVGRDVEGGLAPLLERRRLSGLAAYRARIARVSAAEAAGDRDRAARLRRENGTVTAWTFAGPFAVHHALDFDRRYAPDEGDLPASIPGPLGLPPRVTREIACPDGTVALDGEPRDGEVFYLAADVTLAKGGRYLVALGTSMSVRLLVDGAPVHERRAFEAHLPALVHLPIALAPGRHRVLVKATRGDALGAFHLAFARADGAPSDAVAATPGPGRAPAAAARPVVTRPVFGARDLEALLEADAGPALARLLAGVDASRVDREGAKVLLAEAATAVPASAAVRVARAEVLLADETLDPKVARARAEAELREALARDPAHAEARATLARLLIDAGRLDEADETLAGLSPAAADRPQALEVRARAADARGLAERAEALVAAGLRVGGSCALLDLGRELAGRRRAVAEEDVRARALLECPGGREKIAQHLRRRGDARGAVEVLRPLVDARPWAIEPTVALGEALVAAGEPARAADLFEALRAIWPRNPAVEKQLADARELAGDRPAARAARERALTLDGADLALRRALALEDGHEVLDAWAEDAGAALRAYRAARRTDDTSSSMVLDAAAVEIHPGGAATDRTHQVIHVLDQQAVEQFGEFAVPPGADLLVLRTLKPDGRTIEPERAGATKGTVSLAGLEPGDFVEIEYLRGVRGSAVGFAADPFFFRVAGTRLFRSSYVVSAPAGLGLEVDAHGMSAPPVTREAGRDVVRAVAQDVPAVVPEPSSVPSTEFLPFLHAGVGDDREARQLILADASVEADRSTAEIRTVAREIRAAAGRGASAGAVARAAWARVSRSILGEGGLFEDASVVLSRGRGSRLGVLKAVLGELGIRARIAFARPFAADPSPWRFPSHAFSYPLLRVEAGGETIWMDPALRLAPSGTLPSSVEDAEALILPGPGETPDVVRTPLSAVEERREVRVRVVLSGDGSAVVSGEDRYFGAAAAAAKGTLERLDASDRRQAVEAMLARSFRGLRVAEVEIAGDTDPDAALAIRWRGEVPHLARAAGERLVVDGPLAPVALGSDFVQVAARSTPLLVPIPFRVAQRIEIAAPDGLAAVATPPRAVESPFGTFTHSDGWSNGTLVREDRIEVRRSRVPPARYAEFAAFAATVDGVQAQDAVFAPVH